MMKIIEPRISTYTEYLAMCEAIQTDTFEAIVWVAPLEYRLPSGSLVEAAFFMNASSQGFRVMLSHSPHSPSFWCPWGQSYIFYLILREADNA